MCMHDSCLQACCNPVQRGTVRYPHLSDLLALQYILIWTGKAGWHVQEKVPQQQHEGYDLQGMRVVTVAVCTFPCTSCMSCASWTTAPR